MRGAPLRLSLLILCATVQLQLWILRPWLYDSFGNGLKDSLKGSFGIDVISVFRLPGAAPKVNYVVLVLFSYATLLGLVLILCFWIPSATASEPIANIQSPLPATPPGIDHPSLPQPESRSVVGGGIADELAKIKVLFDQGVLSEAEFVQTKQRLLG